MHDMDMSGSGGGMDHAHHHGMGGMGSGGDGPACKISMLWNWNTIDACFFTQSWHIRSRGMFAGSCIGIFFLAVCLQLLQRVSVEYDRSADGASTFLNGYAPALFGKRLTSTQHETHSPAINPAIGHADSGQAASNHQSELDVKNGSPLFGSSKSSIHADTNRMTGSAAPYVRDESNELLAGSMLRRPFLQKTAIRRAIRAVIFTCQFTVAYLLMLLAMYYNAYVFICIVLGTFFGHLAFSSESQNTRGTARYGRT